jgi:GNAT superfamily N-acetyltransferase
MAVVIREMTDADIDAAVRVQLAAFADLDRREGHQPVEVTERMVQRSGDRHRHLIKHDPDGALVALEDDTVVGSALALRRGDLWGLSLLVVDPASQSGGVGRQLLDASLRYADECERAVILSTSDPRAMRLYATSGFTLHPQVHAVGSPDRDSVPAIGGRIRDGSPADIEFADRVDAAVRRSPHGPDHELMSSQLTMFVADDSTGGGYAYFRGDGEVYLLAATDEDTAISLLWRCAAHAVELGTKVTIEHLNAAQQWAVEVAYAARLQVTPAGPVFWRNGAPPPCYLPSGAYL